LNRPESHRLNVRFGSKADIAWIKRDVRFTPKAEIAERDRQVRFVPKADIGDPHFVYCSSVTFSNQSTALPSSLS
jgi:hypothetical protein